eukprot:TRINITY_DN4264_c0_g1_i1.p1 TRINITY_DN4264_c0_g1~~TRINITY_DN4264_c0_g1_i1.p1  ORF type:complete len:1003 (+),score=296.76 TRINITY_DN4264_c0_g1_i1:91-3099(+)
MSLDFDILDFADAEEAPKQAQAPKPRTKQLSMSSKQKMSISDRVLAGQEEMKAAEAAFRARQQQILSKAAEILDPPEPLIPSSPSRSAPSTLNSIKQRSSSKPKPVREAVVAAEPLFQEDVLHAQMEQESLNEIDRNQLIKFQTMLVNAADRHQTRIQDELYEQEKLAKSEAERRETLALSLADAFTTNRKLRDAVVKTEQAEARTREQMDQIRVDRNGLQAQVSDIQKANTALQSDKHNLELVVVKQSDSHAKLALANQMHSSQIRIFKSIEERVQQDLAVLKTQLETALKSNKEKDEELRLSKDQNGMLQERLQDQVEQVKLVRRNENRLVSELETTQQAKEAMVRFWEEAMTAMSRRDEMLNTMSAQYETAMAEKSSAVAAHEALHKMQQVTKAQVEAIRESLVAAKEESGKFKKQAEEAQVARDRLAMEVALVSKEHTVARQQEQAAQQRAEAMQREIHVTRQRLDETADTLKQVAMQHHEAASLINDIQRAPRDMHPVQVQLSETQLRISQLENELAVARARANHAERQLKQSTNENEIMLQQTEVLDRHRDTMALSEARSQDRMLRAEYRQFQLEAELQTWRDQQDPTSSLMFQIDSLNKKVDAAQADSERARQLQILAEGRVIEMERGSKQVEQDSQRLKERVFSLEWLNDQLLREIADVTSAQQENILERNEQQLKADRLNKQLANAREQIVERQAALEDSQYNRAAAKEITKAHLDTMQMEINQLRHDRAELAKTTQDTMTSSASLKARIQFQEEQLKISTDARRKLEVTVIKLQKRLIDADKRSDAAESGMKQLGKQFEHWHNRKADQADKERNAMTSAAPSEESSAAVQARMAEVSHDNLVLTQRHGELAQRLIMMDRNMAETTQQQKQLHRENKALRMQLEIQSNKLFFSNALAASLEQQLLSMGLNENTISYNVNLSVEPTLSLRTALYGDGSGSKPSSAKTSATPPATLRDTLSSLQSLVGGPIGLSPRPTGLPTPRSTPRGTQRSYR